MERPVERRSNEISPFLVDCKSTLMASQRISAEDRRSTTNILSKLKKLDESVTKLHVSQTNFRRFIYLYTGASGESGDTRRYYIRSSPVRASLTPPQSLTLSDPLSLLANELGAHWLNSYHDDIKR
jgi:hypothetical protein